MNSICFLVYRTPKLHLFNNFIFIKHLYSYIFAVVFLDVNNLKTVNDTYGHDFGDMLILAACNLICQTFKDSSVYRLSKQSCYQTIFGRE